MPRVQGTSKLETRMCLRVQDILRCLLS